MYNILKKIKNRNNKSNLSDFKEIKENARKNSSISILKSAKLLIGFFFMNEREKYCSRILIEQLLIIANFIELKNNRLLFEPKIKESHIGLRYMDLSWYIPSDITLDFDMDYIPSNKPIQFKEVENYHIPRYFEVEKDYFSKEDYKLLLDVFTQFSDWSPKELAYEFEKFKNIIISDLGDDYSMKNIDNRKVQCFLNNYNIKKYDSRVLDYIVSYKKY